MNPEEALIHALVQTFAEEEELFARRVANPLLDARSRAGAALRISIVRQLQENILRHSKRFAANLPRDDVLVIDVSYEEIME